MAWQYCECGAELNPSDEEIIGGTINCSECGDVNDIAYLDDVREELLKQMYRDVRELKQDLKFIATKLEVEY